MSEYSWSDDPDFHRKYSLRRAVYYRFNKPDETVLNITELARLLGYATESDLKRYQSAEDDRKMRLLAGPYGPVIYKAMLRRVKKK